MTTPDGAVATTALAGRTTISARALDRVVAAVASQALGVTPRQVSADIADASGNLVLVVSAPIRLVSLRDIAADPGLVARTGGTVFERADHAQRTIHAEVEELTGSTITSVEVRLTGAQLHPESRVK